MRKFILSSPQFKIERSSYTSTGSKDAIKRSAMRLQTRKRVQRTSIITVLLLLIGAGVLSAQITPDCNDPSCAGTWNTYSATVPASAYFSCTSTPNCLIKVNFFYRDCGGQVPCEYFLYSIDNVNPQSNCLSSLNCNWSDWMQGAIRVMMDALPPGSNCNPQSGECITNVRITTGACWKTILNAQREVIRRIDCGVNSCCRANFRICREESGILKIYPTSIQSPNIVECPTDPSPEPNDDCIPICDHLM